MQQKSIKEFERSHFGYYFTVIVRQWGMLCHIEKEGDMPVGVVWLYKSCE